MEAVADLVAGRELDALVAEKVMGLRAYRKWPDADYDSWYVYPAAAGTVPSWDEDEMSSYSTDIGAAWQVAEALATRTVPLYVEIGRRSDSWTVEVWTYCGAHGDRCGSVAPSVILSDQESAPLAICRAALAAVDHR